MIETPEQVLIWVTVIGGGMFGIGVLSWLSGQLLSRDTRITLMLTGGFTSIAGLIALLINRG